MERSSFICIHFSFIAPVEGLCCKPKYWANIIHHYIFVFFLYFFNHSFSGCRKDQFTPPDTQDFTDPDLLTIRGTLTGLSLWFCLRKCSWNFQRPVFLRSGQLWIFSRTNHHTEYRKIPKISPSKYKPPKIVKKKPSVKSPLRI